MLLFTGLPVNCSEKIDKSIWLSSLYCAMMNKSKADVLPAPKAISDVSPAPKAIIREYKIYLFAVHLSFLLFGNIKGRKDKQAAANFVIHDTQQMTKRKVRKKMDTQNKISYNVNYQKRLDKVIASLQDEDKVPKLLLHSCCAPCSSYVLEYLSNFFEITVFYYNPNVFPESEYTKRLLEQQTLIAQMDFMHPVSFLAGNYDKDKFYEMAAGLEHLKEGGARCFQCYELRLRETAEMAVKKGFDYFTTTLSISPHKNAIKLNNIGMKVADLYGVKYLQSDFKKKNGYKRSIELSVEYGLYRQNYCGCQFSLEG